jgi:cytochrome c biogenesis protein CcmG/thiol:disulfide interchange protein DsbE
MKIKSFLIILLLSSIFVILYNYIEPNQKHLNPIALPEFHLPIIGDESKYLSLDEIRGEVFIMNFFATWCKVCLQEHKYLVLLSKEIATPIYGVAIRDHDQNIDKLLNNFGNPYKLTLADMNGYSNTIPIRGLPTTILVDENGNIIAAHSGAMSKNIFDHKFLPYIQ